MQVPKSTNPRQLLCLQSARQNKSSWDWDYHRLASWTTHFKHKIILLSYSFTYYLLCQDPKLYSIISASFCKIIKDRKETLKTELFSSSVPNKNFAILEYNLYKDEKYRFHSHIAKVFCTLWKHLSFHNMHFTCNISIVFLIFRTIYIRKQYNYIFLIWIIFWRPIQKVSNVNSEKSTPSITSV